MRIRVNGDELEVEEGATVTALIARYELRAEQVAVERNRELVPRASFGVTVLQAGDTLEIVTLVGGG